MKLAVIGVNHKTAPVSLREKLSFGVDLADAYASLKCLPQFGGAVIVSTCNRSEIYVGFEGQNERADDDSDNDDENSTISPQSEGVRTWLANFKQLALAEIAPFLYVYEGTKAINHWLRVASGLDSMILGEPQILGQIRQAVAFSQGERAIGGAFDWLTQQIFASARSVRRDSKLGEQAVTLGFATAKLVTQIFDKPSETTLLIVASGEMNRLVAHNVATLGMTRIIIANRTIENAHALKDELTDMATHAGRTVAVECVGLDRLAEVLTQADVVSSCSGSMNMLIDVAMVKHAQKIRRHRPLLMVDLAVPRDIAPEVAHLDDVYLYSVDDLQHVIAGNIEERKQAAVEAELMASQLTTYIESQMQLLSARRFISDYRTDAHAHKERLLAQATARLAQGEDAQTVLDEFAHALTQTLTHAPSRLIRTVATHADTEVLDMVVNGLKAYRH